MQVSTLWSPASTQPMSSRQQAGSIGSASERYEYYI
jgi:hypothetical protein